LKKNITKVELSGGVSSVKFDIPLSMERWLALKILKICEKFNSILGTFQRFEFDLEAPYHRHGADIYIGIDPGSRHMGLTILKSDGLGETYEIELPTQPDALSKMHVVRKMMEWILDKELGLITQPIYAVIEGSGYSMPFGQTELAEARAVAMLTLDSYGIKVNVIPPTSIRKKVFGSAKIHAEDLWKELIPPNAASSIACAMCCTKL